jgi:hypothetical protein
MEHEKEIIYLRRWIECLLEENKRLESEVNELLHGKRPPTQSQVMQRILFHTINGPVTVNVYG